MRDAEALVAPAKGEGNTYHQNGDRQKETEI